ncbi:MAG: hypothetical protein IPK13_22475 [Deltaproteobacteria bacterium]|nr:hypothetical protein [Deltaproteobacteria bacterium]
MNGRIKVLQRLKGVRKRMRDVAVAHAADAARRHEEAESVRWAKDEEKSAVLESATTRLSGDVAPRQFDLFERERMLATAALDGAVAFAQERQRQAEVADSLARLKARDFKRAERVLERAITQQKKDELRTEQKNHDELAATLGARGLHESSE